MKIITSLDKLKILTFWDILKDGNYARLDLNYEAENQYSEKESSDLFQAWMKLYDDYFILKNDSKSKQFLKSKQEEIILLYKIELFGEIQLLLEKLQIYKISLPEDTFKEVRANIYKSIQTLHPGLKVPDELDKASRFIEKVISSLTTKYNLNFKKNEKKVDKELENVYKVVAQVGLILGVQLNVNEMNVMEWLAYEQTAKEKSKAKTVKNGTR